MSVSNHQPVSSARALQAAIIGGAIPSCVLIGDEFTDKLERASQWSVELIKDIFLCVEEDQIGSKLLTTRKNGMNALQWLLQREFDDDVAEALEAFADHAYEFGEYFLQKLLDECQSISDEQKEIFTQHEFLLQYPVSGDEM